jgi:hypothetical protein
MRIFEKPPECFFPFFSDYLPVTVQIKVWFDDFFIFYFSKIHFHLNTAYIPAIQYVGMY